jgi:hypothetical protein
VSELGGAAENLERFYQAIAAHDRESLTHVARGIGVSRVDMRRLGFEDSEELWPGILMHVDDRPPGGFRVLCSGEHSLDTAAGGERTGYWDGVLAAE